MFATIASDGVAVYSQTESEWAYAFSHETVGLASLLNQLTACGSCGDPCIRPGLMGEAVDPAPCWGAFLEEAAVVFNTEPGIRRSVDVVASSGGEVPAWTARKTTSSDP